MILGSPAILGDREEDGGADDGASDFNYNSENQNEKQKIEHMLGWQMAYGRAEEAIAPNYDKEVSHNHIPLLSGGQEVVQLGFSDVFLHSHTQPFKMSTFSIIPLLASIFEWSLKFVFLWYIFNFRFLENYLLPHLRGCQWHPQVAEGSVPIIFNIRLTLIIHVFAPPLELCTFSCSVIIIFLLYLVVW